MQTRSGGGREASTDRLVQGEADRVALADQRVVVASLPGLHPTTAVVVVERALRRVATLTATKVDQPKLLSCLFGLLCSSQFVRA